MTPYEKIQKSFYSQFKSKEVIPESLEEEWYKQAIGEYSVEIEEISIDKNNNITEDISLFKIKLIGKLMYSYYLYREYDKKLKLSNLIGRDISINGIQDTQRNLKNAYELKRNEIDLDFEKIKPSSYV